MAGGAVGSILAQALKLTADERKTLLVAGAAAGMAATFNAPLASVLLAVELLLFSGARAAWSRSARPSRSRSSAAAGCSAAPRSSRSPTWCTRARPRSAWR